MKKLYQIFLVLIFFLTCCSSQKEGISVLQIDSDGELFPVFCALGSKILEKEDGLFTWTIKNNTNQNTTLQIISEVLDYSFPAIKTITLKPKETKKIAQFPVFNDKILNLPEQKIATIRFKALQNNQPFFEETREVTLLATGDMIWDLESGYDLTFLIAAWVTPRDPIIAKILKQAKEKMHDRSLLGYQRETNKKILKEIEAIWETIKAMEISYVDSAVSYALGSTQKIKFPIESIEEKSANCADGTVLFASIFESLGLDPLIIVTQNHVFLGVKGKEINKETPIFFIETTMVGTSSLEEALEVGAQNYAEQEKLIQDKDYVILDITSLRKAGITPMPIKK